jgi:Tfp pilus assembly protein PilO
VNYLRSLPKDKLQKVILVAIVTVIALAVIGNFHVWAQVSSMSSSKAQIAKLKQEIDDAEREAKQEAQNHHLHEQVAAFVEDQTTMMVSGDPFSWVVRHITLFAENHPVHVLSMRPGAKVQSMQKSRFDVYTAHIEVEGGYDQIGQFVRDFENTFPTSQIRSVELVPGGTTQADRRASMELAFLVQPDSVPGKADAKPKAGKKGAS